MKPFEKITSFRKALWAFVCVGMEEWLKTPLFDSSSRWTIISNPDIVKKAKKKFDELWKKGKKLEEGDETLHACKKGVRKTLAG